MALKIGVVSQKGGVGKSTLSRMIAREYSAAGWDVKLADMDPSQGTSFKWHSRRLGNGLEPQVSVEMFKRVADALKKADSYDLIIFDGAPHSTEATKQIAEECAMVILPTGNALDDLEPTVALARELHNNGITKEKIAFVLCRVGNSETETQQAADYLESSGFFLLAGSLPEKTVYRRASDTGRAATETSHPSTNERAMEVMRSITARLSKLNGKKA